MPNVDATREVQIAGHKFTLHTPFSEGDVIDAATARQLNQVRCENIGNNFRKRLGDAGEDAGKLQELANELAKYDLDYTFNMPGAGGGRTVRDPVEKEARAIAMTKIKAHLAKTGGRKVKDIDADKLEAQVQKIANQDDVIKLAKKRVRERQAVVDAEVEMDLG